MVAKSRFIEKLNRKIQSLDCPVCVGLDPRMDLIPESIKKNHDDPFLAVFEFNYRIIDAIYDIAPVVKLQLACYEALGTAGFSVFERTCRYAGDRGMMVIADGKRNDIGSTAEEYAKAYLDDPFHAPDALTVNPYLGEDCIRPFAEKCIENNKGIFVLVKTSNKSSSQIQNLRLEDGRILYEAVADLTNSWSQEYEGAIGAVVGATWPEEARKLRKMMPGVFFLVPGYGAQGGTADDAAESFLSDRTGAVVNASRSIIGAWKSDTWSREFSPEKFEEASRAEVLRMKDDLNSALGRAGKTYEKNGL